MKKRLLSLGLALVMLLSLLPASVLAKDYGYGEKPATGTNYEVGDTIVLQARWEGFLIFGYYTYDLPTNIPADTRWERIGAGVCQYPDHWDDDDDHTSSCSYGYYAQFKLVSTVTPDTTPGKVTASKTAAQNNDGTYTITLSVQGNKTTASTAVNSDVVLVVDNSSSMGSGNGSRLETAKTAAKMFISNLLVEGKDNRIAVVGFGGDGGGTGESELKVTEGLTAVKATADAAVSKMRYVYNTGTNYTAALEKAYNYLNGRSDKTRAGMVVFLTDGGPGTYNGNGWDSSNWNGSEQVKKIKDDHYEIYTIGININGTHLTNLNALSSGDGYHYNVNDSTLSTQLPAILTKIAYRINDVPAGTNAEMVDKVNLSDFEIVVADGEPQVSCSAGTANVADDGTVTWNLDEIPEDGATCTIQVRLKEKSRTDGARVYTNTDVNLNYTDPDGAPATKGKSEIGDPYFDLGANAASYTVYHYDMGENEIADTDTGVKRIGDKLTVADFKKTIAGYTYDHADPADGEKVIAQGGDNILKLYYTSNSYTVTYDANGGTGAPAAQTKYHNVDLVLSSTQPTRDGHTFQGWATSSSATTAAYAAGGTYSENASTTLYAVWARQTGLSYTIKYWDKDDSTAPIDTETVGGQTYGDIVTVTDAMKKTISGYVFDADNVNNTVSLTIGTDNTANVINLYYEKAYTLTYDPGMGSGTPVVEKHATSPVTLAAGDQGFTGPAAGEGHKNVVFVGWSETNYNKIFSHTDTTKPVLVTSVSFDAQNTSKTVYAVWSYDDIGNGQNGPGESDGKADVFQAEVTYKVVNGTWSDDSTDAKKVVFDLKTKANGVWTDVTPAPTLGDIPTGMKPADGYAADSGAWNTTISGTTPVTGDAEYTFTFSTRLYKLIYNGNAQGGGTVTGVPTDSYWYAGDAKNVYLEYRDVPTHSDVNGKKVVFVGWSEAPTTKIYSKDDNGLNDAERKALMVTSVDFNNADKTVYAVWSYDEIGNNPNGPADGKYPDGTPDVLQAAATYKVVNGYWADGTTADKVYVFDLMMKDELDGHWLTKENQMGNPIPIPTGMTPAAGCTGGAWDKPAPVGGNQVGGDITFIYRFTEIGTLKVDPEDPNGDGKKDDALVWKKLAVSGTGFRGETFTVTLYPVTEGDSAEQGPDPRMLRSLFEVEESYTGTVTMTAAGTKAFSFTEDNYLTFTEPGHYWFKVVETKGSTKNMTYDEAEHYLYIQIGLHNDGTLYVAEYKDSVTVENSYKGSTGVVVPADKLVQLEKGDHFNYVMGYSDGTIRPNNQITRAEVAIIFFRLLTKESRDYYYSESNDFTDVAATSKSNIAISTLTKAGILTGYSDGTFRPNAKVTRGQLAAIIARFADMKGDVDKTFTDIDGYWAKDLILLAASNGWIDGFGDGTFRPANNITRAQTMAIINRALDRQVSHVEDLLDEEVMNVWVDNMDPEAWYYFHVQEATNYHSYVRKGVNTLDEKWTAKIEDIDWAVYQF